MNNETIDTELTPGTRVILTGWNEQHLIPDHTKKLLAETFPIKAVFIRKSYYGTAISNLPHFQISKDDSWHFSLFTYEIDNEQL